MSQQVNLFNPAFLKQKQVFTATTMARALVLLLAGTLALVVYGRQHVAQLEAEAASGARQLAQKKQRQAAVLVEFAPRKKDPGIDAELAKAQAEKAGFEDVMRMLDGGDLGNTKGFSPTFKALARQSMGELWLTGVTIEGAGGEIDLRGRATDPALVPAYISRLRREPAMQGKSFGGMQIARGEKPRTSEAAVELNPYVDFSLVALPEKTADPQLAAKPAEELRR